MKKEIRLEDSKKSKLLFEPFFLLGMIRNVFDQNFRSLSPGGDNHKYVQFNFLYYNVIIEQIQ